MNKYMPDYYYKNIFEINYNKLKKNNIKYLFFDVDNSILPYTMNYPQENTKKLFNKLKKDDFKCILFSNSNSKRIFNIKNALKVDAYTSCMKPLNKNYKKVLNNYKKEECIFIGDQIMTDVFGAKRNGFKVILLDRLDNKEPITTNFWRFLEKIVIKKLNKKYNFEKGKYYE